MKRTCKRKKAFLGAIIGAVTSIAGSAISAASQRKAQEKQIKRENYISRNQSANNLSDAYSNEEYVDDFLNKTTFKYGGNKTMACGNRKTAKMGMSDRYKKQLETEAKNRQETKKRLSAKNTKPFPYVSTIAQQKSPSDYTHIYVTNPFITTIERTRMAIRDANTQNPVKPSSSTKATTTSTKKPASPVTRTRTAVKRNTNTASTTNRNTTRQTITNRNNAPVKTNVATNKPAQRTTQRPANTSIQRTAKPAIQKTTNQSNAKTTTSKATTTKTNSKPARQNADNKLTFSRAFANARRAGKDTFNWNGKSYTTQLAGEIKAKPYNAAKLNTSTIDAASASKELAPTSINSVIPKSSEYYDRINMMKCGGKRKRK